MQGRDAGLLARLSELPMGQAVISSVTLAELEYGLHRKGQPIGLQNALLAQGINLSDLDMTIAAHCVATDTTLVSRDKAFQNVASIASEKLLPDSFRLEVW